MPWWRTYQSMWHLASYIRDTMRMCSPWQDNPPETPQGFCKLVCFLVAWKLLSRSWLHLSMLWWDPHQNLSFTTSIGIYGTRWWVLIFKVPKLLSVFHFSESFHFYNIWSINIYLMLLWLRHCARHRGYNGAQLFLVTHSIVFSGDWVNNWFPGDCTSCVYSKKGKGGSSVFWSRCFKNLICLGQWQQAPLRWVTSETMVESWREHLYLYQHMTSPPTWCSGFQSCDMRLEEFWGSF